MQKNLEKKELDKSLKFIFESSIFVFIAIIFSKLLTYAYRIIIARYFGPEVYGLFSLAIMILSFLVAFSSLGLVEGVLRFTSYYQGKNEIHKIRYIFKLSASILLTSSILFAILLFSFSKIISINLFHEPELILFLRIFSFLIPVYLFLYLFSIIIQAFEKIKVQSFILDFLENFLKLIFLITLIFLGLKTNAVIFSYSLGVIIAGLVAFIYCRYKISDIFKKYELDSKSKIEIKTKLLSYSWPLVFYSILFGILPYIDSFTIGYFKGAFDVGLYNAAVPLATLMVLFPQLFMRLFFPLVTKEYSRKNLSVINELSKQIEKWIIIVNLPVFLMMVIFPGAIINIFFGPDYILAENSLRFLAIGFLFYSTSIISHNLISMIGKTRLILMNILFASILNLILNIILVPRFGINGAAISTAITYIILTLVFFFQVKIYVSIVPIRRKLFRVTLSAIIPTIILIYIKQFIPINLLTIIVLGGFFTLLYMLMIFLTKSLDDNDLMILKSINNKMKFQR